MSGPLRVGALLAVMLLAGAAWAAGPQRFWNTTSATITSLRLAVAGSGQWSRNQCDNDPDHAVEADERLRLDGFAPGRYDVELVEKSGRRCVVANVEVKDSGPYAFAIGDQDLRNCHP